MRTQSYNLFASGWTDDAINDAIAGVCKTENVYPRLEYVTDLNAMKSVEDSMDLTQRQAYAELLQRQIMWTCFAGARLRAITFLRIHGKL